jgi:2-alkenal reductase
VVTVINEQRFQGADSSDAEPAGSGTGFIIDDKGHIVTNWHVVQGGDRFEVIFADGDARRAELVGSDQISDLAVVRVEGELPGIVPLGDSDELKPGQPVLAIGSPLGAFTNTVTQGIVSAIGRNFPLSGGQGPQVYTNLIQHDAAINPGNSGGPLFNFAGEVVGVNTLGIPTAASGQPVQGLFFAVPASTAERITDQIIDTGEVVYPYFGIGPVAVTREVAVQAGLDIDYGVYVAQVSPGGPAAEAGIEEGDVILAIDGQRIDEQNSFAEVLFAHRPGDTVEATILRDGDESTVEVTLGERPEA